MLNIDEDTITQAVIARHAQARGARLREVTTCLVQHLHAFAREVKLSEAEWADGMQFLTDVGQISSAQRQEFNLLSDVLGLSMLVTAMNQRRPAGCTEASVPGRLHVEAAPHVPHVPHVPHGTDLTDGAVGQPCFVRGRVRALEGQAIAGARLEVWQSNSDGSRDVKRVGYPAHGACAMLSSGADGGFHFRSILAEPCAIAHDGPVGRLLQQLGRHPWRPAHLRFIISAPGFETLSTHVFREGGQYLDSDAVFGVRSSLVANWVEHAPGTAPDGSTSAVPFTTLDFEFVLNKARPGAQGRKPL